MSERSWQLHPNVHPMTVSTLLDAMMDLGSAAEGLLDKKSLFDTEGAGACSRPSSARSQFPCGSSALDGEGALLKKAIASPTFPPLGGQKSRYGRTTISWRSERREVVFTYANGKKETVVVPESKQEIEIGRLYRHRLPRRRGVHDSQPFRFHGAPRFDGCLARRQGSAGELC